MVFLVLLAPLLVMGFALLMERIEHRLRTRAVSEQEVEEFLDNARPDEVDTFVKEGWTRALSKFRLRSRRNRPSWRARLFSSSRSGGRRNGGASGSRGGSTGVDGPAARPARGEAAAQGATRRPGVRDG